MAKEYQVIWKSIDLNDDSEIIRVVVTNDVKFQHQYIAMEIGGDDNKVTYVPYDRIVEINKTGEDDKLNRMFGENYA